MTKFGRELVASMEEALAYTKGDAKGLRVHIPLKVDVRAIRKKLNMTQDEFAGRFGFPKGTVRDWEQKRTEPQASARVLLTVIDHEPEAVMRALESA
jgi:putative transcriptional regulator